MLAHPLLLGFLAGALTIALVVWLGIRWLNHRVGGALRITLAVALRIGRPKKQKQRGVRRLIAESQEDLGV